MCGIAGFHIKKKDYVKDHDSMEAMLNSLLHGIEHRGTEATGFVATTFDKGKTIVDKKAVKARDFTKKRRPLPKNTMTVLGHTRLATQGLPSNPLNNHPVLYGSTFITHNGFIRNDDKIFADLKKKRNGEVDSEAIAALISHYKFGKLRDAINKLEGGFAVAAIDPIAAPGKLALFKNSANPLFFYDCDDFLIWASEGHIISSAMEKALGKQWVPQRAEISQLYGGELLEVDHDKVTLHKSQVTASQGYSHYHRNEEDDDAWAEFCGLTPEKPNRRPWFLDRGTDEDPPVFLMGAVRSMRQDGNGKARLFRRLPLLSAEEKIGLHGTWKLCRGCNETVAQEDYITHLKYGKICMDCTVLLEKRTAARIDLDRAEIESIEKWVDIEDEIHSNSCCEVANRTGISIAAIDFLVNRATPSYKNGSGLERQKICRAVDRAYEEAFESSWSKFEEKLIEEEEEREEDEIETGSLDNMEEFWIDCPGGVHKNTEPCVNCKEILTAEEKKEVLQSLKHKKGHCLTALCDEKAKVFITADYCWCKNHYKKCALKDCSNDTVGWNKLGQRLCHFHIRGKKGALADNHIRALKRAENVL